MSAAGEDLIAFRCGCGKRLKLPITAAGRLARCPKCGQPVRVPLAASAPDPAAPLPGSAPAATSAAESTDEFRFAPLPPETGATDAGAAALTQSCPACGRGWPGSARICTDCGVYLATGKAIVTTQEDNLDEAYMKAQGLLALLSWWFWVGLLPIASEAFGLRRPYVIRAVGVLTIAASLAFFFALWPEPATGGPAGRFMLWGGDRARLGVDWSEYAAELRDEGLSNAQIDARIAAEKQHLEASVHDFAYYQLLTHQFLHADILHLVGNLIFLFLLGSRVNALVGQLWTAILYPLLGVAAALAHLAALHDRPWGPMLGASGAISGLAGMYLVLFPVQRIHMVFWYRFGLIRLFELHIHFFAVRGFWVVLWYFGFDVLYVYLGVEDGVAYWAHVGGFAAGIAAALLLLITRRVNARGGDLITALLGRRGWVLVGRPRTTG